MLYSIIGTDVGNSLPLRKSASAPSPHLAMDGESVLESPADGDKPSTAGI